MLYFIQSLRMTEFENIDAPSHNLVSFFLYWRNVFSVFIIFAAYLILLPYLGMLVGNVAFSFVLLSVLGGWRSFLMHGLIAIGTSGGIGSEPGTIIVSTSGCRHDLLRITS